MRWLLLGCELLHAAWTPDMEALAAKTRGRLYAEYYHSPCEERRLATFASPRMLCAEESGIRSTGSGSNCADAGSKP